MTYETLQINIRDNVTHILLNRPERLNSFDLKLGEELSEVLHDIKKNPDIRAVVIKGTGKGFCGDSRRF